MTIKREWATPITVGAFLVSAITGVLMFFHLEMPLNKLAHEWLSWILLIGAMLHITIHFSGFKRYFSINKSGLIIGIFTLTLLLSFIPIEGKKREPPFVHPIELLTKAPISTLAIIAQVSPEMMLERLQKVGFDAKSGQQSIEDLVGNNFRKKARLLEKLL